MDLFGALLVILASFFVFKACSEHTREADIIGFIALSALPIATQVAHITEGHRGHIIFLSVLWLVFVLLLVAVIRAKQEESPSGYYNPSRAIIVSVIGILSIIFLLYFSKFAGWHSLNLWLA